MRIVTMRDVKLASGSTTLNPAGTTTIYTKSIQTKYGEYFSVWYKASSPGVVNVTIQMEESWIVPTTQGSSDGNWVIPELARDIVTNLADENQHLTVLRPIVSPHIRFKITGVSTNDALTTLRMRIGLQEG
jgi:hypothetical protein